MNLSVEKMSILSKLDPSKFLEYFTTYKSNFYMTFLALAIVAYTQSYFLFENTRDVNNSIMEMLIMCYACKSNSCGKVIGVIPYLPYSAQSK